MFLDSELEIYYDLLKNDKILLQCLESNRDFWCVGHLTWELKKRYMA